MNTPICPTCGCSLIRLGVTKENTITRTYNKNEYSFCCEGCAVIFEQTPEALLQETKHLVVCPSCLTEKHIEHTNAINYKGTKYNFCKCPYCETVFKEEPDYYIKRLLGEIHYSGVFSDGRGCCSE